MAAASDERQRALIYLRSLELMLGDLPEVADEWADLSDGERESWSHDWDNEMGSLHYLAGCVAQGCLDKESISRYHGILDRLTDALPTLKHLNLQLPSVPSTP